jgi:16S rRNA (adenine1518-N6/adenine1519-N6)-dimethyltransferase
MLRASLKSFGGVEFLEAAGIDPTARPETLSVEQFCALARAVARK